MKFATFAVGRNGRAELRGMLDSLDLSAVENRVAQSALWDTFEPFLIGAPGFGAGRRVEVPLSKSRVTAASTIAGGDADRAAAASAFTQAELDALAARGIKPWDPEARAALKKLGW